MPPVPPRFLHLWTVQPHDCACSQPWSGHFHHQLHLHWSFRFSKSGTYQDCEAKEIHLSLPLSSIYPLQQIIGQNVDVSSTISVHVLFSKTGGVQICWVCTCRYYVVCTLCIWSTSCYPTICPSDHWRIAASEHRCEADAWDSWGKPDKNPVPPCKL